MLPKTDASGRPIGELLEVSMGPHHPSTHGVFRMDVVLDGEEVVRLKPVFGYLHRNHEKIAREHLVSGLDALHRPAGLFVFDDEQLGLRADHGKARRACSRPERAEYIRVIMAELTRLQNHTCLIGFFVQDMGALARR